MRSKLLSAGLFFALLAQGCGKSEPPKPATSGGSSPSSPAVGGGTVRPRDPRHDYQKPYLTEAKMTHFLDSMKEEKNPFEPVFRPGGQFQNMATLQERLAEFNAYAQKHGFEGYEDYMAVWGRITVGESALLAEDMWKNIRKMQEEQVTEAEAQLAKPDLNPELRKAYENQLATARKSLEDPKTKEQKKLLNDEDLALFKKYKGQIDEARKKYQAADKK